MNTTSASNGSESTGGAENVVDRAAQSARAMVDRVAETAGPAVDRLRSNVDSAAEKLRSGVECAGEMQDRLVAECRDCVRSHPLASVGVAVVAGALLGSLFRRH